MPGTDLLERMRRSNPQMKIIMITGNPVLDSAIAALNYGADGYITKPVSNADLLSVIEKKLREQDETLFLDDEKVAEWLESRLLRLDSENTDPHGLR
jgi:DNA-binding response OmpR family regulator